MLTYSAIIPAFNAAPFVHNAIESILAQTTPPLEILVVDDGSSDNTGEVVRKYPIKYIYRKNGGLSAARNTGAKEAQGEWLAFLDADDTWDPKKSAKQLEYALPEIDAIFCEKSPNSDNITFAQMFEANFGGNFSGAMVRRSAFQSLHGFDEDLRSVEDYNFWLRFLLEGHRFRTTPQYYRYTPQSNHLSGNPERMLKAELLNIDKIGKVAALEPERIKLRKQKLRQNYIPAMIGSRQQKEARRHLLHAGYGAGELLKYSAAAFCPTWALDLRRRLRSEPSATEKST
jgi:glycosyltransferase involved in cell wall biosynthesis